MIAKSNLIFKIIIFFIVFLTIDFIFTKLIFSKLLIKNLENIYSQDLDNRIPNKDYKYTFNNNVEFLSKYKDSIYKIHTNDLGFRDFSSSDLDRSQEYIILIGDSFVEGVGLNYNETIGHKLNKANENYFFLNAGVSSYSPYIYNKKVKTILKNNENLKVKKVLLFLDKSDPIDDFNNNYHKLTGKFSTINKTPEYKKNLSERFIVFFILKKLNNFVEENLRSLKYRYQLSNITNKNFFSFTQNQVNAFKSIGNRKSISSWYTNKKKWNDETKNKFMFSIKQIEDLHTYLETLNIELVVVLYPWAYELFDQNVAKIYEEFTTKKLLEINIKTLSCYKIFQKENILNQLEFIGQAFQLADIHYNNFGNQVLSSCIIKNLNFN
tara:strand:- start:342 stop:1484 length:1143 start_codon:yes stop_codon:yes gene_type:complete